MEYLINNRSSVIFPQDDVVKIIQNLDWSKAHRHNNISIPRLQICGPAIFKLLAITF